MNETLDQFAEKHPVATGLIGLYGTGQTLVMEHFEAISKSLTLVGQSLGILISLLSLWLLVRKIRNK